MTYFETHTVTPDMGLRESVNAMLAHVAYNGRPFGYLPSAVHESNYRRLKEDYSAILSADSDYLTLTPRIDDSELLAGIVEELISLCNDYPAYDDEDVSNIEYDRLIEMIDDCKGEHGGENIDSHEIAGELYAIGAHIEQSEYGADVSEEKFKRAIERIKENS